MHTLGFAFSLADFEKSSTIDHIGTRDLTGCLKQPVSVCNFYFGEDRPVGGDFLEKLRCPFDSL